jgi:hypothetical protein
MQAMAADQQGCLRDAGRHVMVQEYGGYARQQWLGAGTEISHDQAANLLSPQFCCHFR